MLTREEQEYLRALLAVRQRRIGGRVRAGLLWAWVTLVVVMALVVMVVSMVGLGAR